MVAGAKVFNGAVGADGRSLLSTPPQRVLVMLGLYALVAAVSAVFAGAVTLGTLRVGGFHELDPPGTALRIGAAVLGWEFVNCLFWAARRWRGPAGMYAFLRTGRAERRHKPGRRSRVLRWARDTAALAAMVSAILLLRFPNEPSAPRAAIAVLVATKVLQAAISLLLATMDKAIGRVSERTQLVQPSSNPNLVPVEDLLSRPDIASQHPYRPRHTGS
ncbi:hypothetical protein [Dactylosporangium darangshiense]|uniref:RDD domain-containing protein n=1 Tax=Dactylosporangium darangshiense TaxID=579108 RepID=A0ABP8DWE3_9ACTN